MSSIQYIEYFQFDNLVRNRIPFLLAHEGFDFNAVYATHEVESLLRTQLQLNFQEGFAKFLADVEKMRIPKHWPLVLMTKEGQAAKEWIVQLQEQGYLNVYDVRGGWAVFVKEAQADLSRQGI